MPTQTISAVIDIAAPVAQVYAYVADLPRHIEWNQQPRAMTPLTDGPLRVGSRFETVEGPPGDLMRMSWEIELSPEGAGTRVVQRGVATPPDSSPFASMANADMAATMQDEVASNLLRLKGILEASR